MSFSFIGILLVTFCILRFAPSRLRWMPLLGASLLYYSLLTSPLIALFLTVIILLTWVFGLGIGAAPTVTQKRACLWGGILVLTLLLVWLKYLPFLRDNLAAVTRFLGIGSDLPVVRQIAVVGVSYFIFQAISYLVDVYRKTLEPERHVGRFALYMSFFPKVIQGPIERGGSLLPQLAELTPVTGENLRFGLSLFVMGMVKKAVIADRLARLVDPVYNNVDSHYGVTLIMATVLFAFQLYFDFSGYTDMALGIARLFNIRLTQNFNSPYLATSVADFWRRWHISFSRWILDYIFTPLHYQFRERGKAGAAMALLVTFLISGIWHGACWGFVVWGLLHGVYLAASLYWKPYQKGLYQRLGIRKGRLLTVWQVITTFQLVCFSFIFFRAPSVTAAMLVVRSSCLDLPRSLADLAAGGSTLREMLFLGATLENVVAVGIALVLLKLLTPGEPDVSGLPLSSRLPIWAKGALYGVLCYLITSYGTGAQSFIYQQF